MIVEPLRLGARAYTTFIHKPAPYYEHVHMEYELTFCLKGSYTLIIDKTPYEMHEGDFSIVDPMHSHEIPDMPMDSDTLCLVIIVGPSMLENFFKSLASKTTDTPVFNINTPKHKTFVNLLNETYYYRINMNEISAMNIKGNVYKILAYVFEHFLTQDVDNKLPNTISASNVQNALDYIRENFSEKITIKDIAAFCGYSETNFCNNFKKITGRTFHYTLNHYRIKMACTLLRDTDLSIEEIASSTGFDEPKSFCRTFKTITGVSPSTYKKTEHIDL
ncbi:MAG: helix-turn-helix transcriptional regulator [Clostridia bacterium]|nr:helix-turn-helix transcriptional regulator [Clostridia bacterium]